MKLLFLISLLAFSMTNQLHTPQQIEKNGMVVSIEHLGDSIRFQLEAPTEGWIAIGFNETDQLKGNYLIMGTVRNGKVWVEEHHTFAPGDFRSYADLGIKSSVSHPVGTEKEGITRISFQLPIKSSHPLGKDLIENKVYTLLMAYSREDDFRHHSIMRTTVRIRL
jgi:hypothetical protein